MSTVGRRRIGRAMCSLVSGLLLLAAQGLGASYAEDCRYFSALPDDCARAGVRKFDGLRDYRYEEIELFAKDPLKKVLYVSFYDTTGLNGGDDSHDSAPAALAQNLDPKRIAKKYQAIAVRIESALSLDCGLACRSRWHSQEFRRSQCGLDGIQPGAQRRDLSQAGAPSPIILPQRRERPSRLQERIGNLPA